jgi:branched-chain amino acid transport system substrate-binding protein
MDLRAGLLSLLLLWPTAGLAGTADQGVKIGVLTDASGIYADYSGDGARVAAEMAIADFGGSVLGKPVRLFFGDHRNLPSRGRDIARAWFDVDHVDMILDLTNSAVALAVQALAQAKNRIIMVTGAGSPDLTGARCSPTAVHYVYDSYALTSATGTAMVAAGGDSWFLLAADYAYGQTVARETEQAVAAAGGRVIGRARHPVGITDFGSFVGAAKASGAKVLAVASSGHDTQELVRQAVALGLTDGEQRVAAPFLNVEDVHRLGLAQAHGVIRTTAFYWDRTEATRAFSRRFLAITERMPSMVQAGDYSAVLHYLRAVAAAGTVRADAVMAQMRALPVHDFFAENGHIRADGRMIHDMYLVEVKSPAESRGPWDYFKILRTIPGEVAFRPLDQGGCKLAVPK